VKPEIEYLPDDHVDEALDSELRNLLTTCFTKPQDVVFKERRYFREPYPHRWVIRNEHGAIVAHIGVHEKNVEAEGRSSRIGGMAEVCVHPDYRGRGYVRMMLVCIHDWLAKHGFEFAVLFGDPRVYGSSGYVQVKNLFNGAGLKRDRKQVTAMIKELSGKPWPRTEVYLPGLTF
jgi:predicted N-acetyltransferase YhbS